MQNSRDTISFEVVNKVGFFKLKSQNNPDLIFVDNQVFVGDNLIGILRKKEDYFEFLKK